MCLFVFFFQYKAKDKNTLKSLQVSLTWIVDLINKMTAAMTFSKFLCWENLNFQYFCDYFYLQVFKSPLTLKRNFYHLLSSAEFRK